jgi:hypothetical protein
MRNRKWRWVTKDTKNAGFVDIWPLTPEPTKSTGPFEEWSQANIASGRVCEREFRLLTGIKVTHNRPIKVLFTAELVK